MGWPALMDKAKASRQERIVVGLLLLTGWLVVLSSMVTHQATTPGGTTPPAAGSLGGQILVLAALTLGAALAIGVRYAGPGAGLRLIARNAWPGLLFGGFLGLFTAFPLRVLVPFDKFWVVLTPLYLGAILFILWFARKAPRGSNEAP